ncbi:MAG: hypothetical protein KAW92_13875 [Candidatus Cloacimonetes bacterium]|nr:hypothetical protein [Candidatus Cloacimonadota bacterium]
MSKSKVYRYLENYNKSGVNYVKFKERGRRRRFYLSLEEEKELFASMSEKSLQCLTLNISDIRNEVEAKIGHKISDDYLWDLLHRHNWKKKSHRLIHPKSNEED